MSGLRIEKRQTIDKIAIRGDSKCETENQTLLLSIRQSAVLFLHTL